MPFMYTFMRSTPGQDSTNGSTNTETDFVSWKPGTRNFWLRAMYLIGKAAALTAISGIAIRLAKFATASTVSTVTISSTSKDPGAQAAKVTAIGVPTAGSTRTNQGVFGCGVAGPGQWISLDMDDDIIVEGSAAGSIDAFSISNTASLNYEWWAEGRE